MNSKNINKEINNLKCFCGNDKKFMRCCGKLINNSNKDNYNEHKERDALKFIKKNLSDYNKKSNHNKCLYTHCNKEAISSHKLQRKGILNEILTSRDEEKINESEIIKSFKYNIINNSMERKNDTTIKQASTFYGFCNNCDTNIFKDIESTSFYEKITNKEYNIIYNDYTNLLKEEEEYIYLLVYRNIAKEIFDLNAIFYTLKKLLDKNSENYKFNLFFIKKYSNIIFERIYLYHNQLNKLLEVKKRLEYEQFNKNFPSSRYKYKFIIPYTRKINKNSLYTTSFIINSIAPFYPELSDDIKKYKLNYFMNIFSFNKNNNNYIFCIYLYDKNKNNEKIIDGHFNVSNYLTGIYHNDLNKSNDIISGLNKEKMMKILDEKYYVGILFPSPHIDSDTKRLINEYNNKEYFLYKCNTSLEFIFLSKIFNNNLEEIYFNEQLYSNIEKYKYKEGKKIDILKNNYIQYILNKNKYLNEYHDFYDYINKDEELYYLSANMSLCDSFKEDLFLKDNIVNFIYLENDDIENELEILKTDTLIANPDINEIHFNNQSDYEKSLSNDFKLILKKH